MRLAIIGFVLCALNPPLAFADDSVPAPAPSKEPELPTLEYTGSSDDAHYTKWEAGQKLCIAETGEPVTVVAPVGEEKTVDKRSDVDYRVKRAGGEAVLFGGALTPLCLSADLDGDGKPEKITVVFTGGFKIRVRVVGGPTLDLRPAGEGFLGHKGGWATASLVATDVAGLPLVAVVSQPQACADFYTKYISFVHGKLRVALSLEGVNDPPAHSSESVKWNRRLGLATVTFEGSADEDEKPSQTVTMYKLDDGVFKKVKR
jgi:hypothetical protein